VVAQLFEHYATSQVVTDSIPDEAFGFFISPNSSSYIMILGFIWLLPEIFLVLNGDGS
jgi:hypothetical protein